MASVISVQENAGAMCSAVTCWETSSMRRRYRRQRLRAAFASKELRTSPLFSMIGFPSSPQDIVDRPVADIVEIAPAPSDHLGQSLVPANFRLPAEVGLDAARV